MLFNLRTYIRSRSKLDPFFTSIRFVSLRSLSPLADYFDSLLHQCSNHIVDELRTVVRLQDLGWTEDGEQRPTGGEQRREPR